MNGPRPRFLPLSWLALPLGLAAAPAPAAPEVDFTREVQPLLAEYCFHCHGPDDQDRRGGLRLDDREAALDRKSVV